MTYIKSVLIILLISIFGLRTYAICDSLSLPKHQIIVGTTGFLLPTFGEYDVSSANKIWQKRFRMLIPNIAYQRNYSNNVSLLLEYRGYRTKYYRFRQNNPNRYGPYSLWVDMYVYSIGVAKGYQKRINEKFILTTKMSGHMQFRFGYEGGIANDTYLKSSIISPGLRASIGEELLFKNKFVLGADIGYNGFKFSVSEKHNHFMSNVLYFGVRF